MPLTDIGIQQVAADSWVAIIEVGGMLSRRDTVRAPTLPAILAAVDERYHTLAGIERPAPLPPPRALEARLPPLRDTRGTSR